MQANLKLLALLGVVAASARSQPVHRPARSSGWSKESGSPPSTRHPQGDGKRRHQRRAELVGIDVRPADGMLYGVTSEGAIVTIDVKSLQATPKAS